MALINKPFRRRLMEGGPIDIAISPQTVTIGALLEHVAPRRRRARVHSLRRGAAEAMEAIVHTDGPQLADRGQAYRGMTCRRATTIGAVVRGKAKVIMRITTRSSRRKDT